MKDLMIDLNNLSDMSLENTLVNGIKEYKPDFVSEAKTRTDRIQDICMVYSSSDLEDAVKGSLYAGRGSIELFRIKIPETLTVDTILKHLADKWSKDQISKASKDALLPVAEKEEPKLNKIRKLTDDKILVQTTILDREMPIYDGYNIVQIKRIKTINSVFDVKRKILQIRTDRANARKCLNLFIEIFQKETFEKIFFTNEMIDSIKIRLNGFTYEYKGKNKNIDSSINTKILRKNDSYPGKLNDSLEFKEETADYLLESDLFTIIDEDEIHKLQLGVRRSSLYFRSYATESIIDKILDHI